MILLKVALQLLILPRITIKLKTDKAHQQHIKTQWEHTIRWFRNRNNYKERNHCIQTQIQISNSRIHKMINHRNFKNLILKIDRPQSIEVSEDLKSIRLSHRELSQVVIDRRTLLKMEIFQIKIRIRTVVQSIIKMILLLKKIITTIKTKWWCNTSSKPRTTTTSTW